MQQKLASKFVKVVLSGIGGDEMFGGYPWRYYRGASAKNFKSIHGRLLSYIGKGLIPNSSISKVFAPIWEDVKDIWTRDIFENVFSNTQIFRNSRRFINHSLYFEAKTFLHGLFVVEDKLSMAHSLETSVPFMDNDLVDFAMHCPVKLKLIILGNVESHRKRFRFREIAKNFRRTTEGKRILREMMEIYIPDSITGDEKRGFLLRMLVGSREKALICQKIE